jgi:hypothetical protein
VDTALASGAIAVGLPFIKKTAVELLKPDYKSQEEVEQKISAGLAQFYREKYPRIFSSRSNDIQSAAAALSAIYDRNVFPDLKVTWGTYPNNMGHMEVPGCFRCHDESHTTSDKKTITQDCSTCHQSLAVEETVPGILKTLGIADILAKTQRQ